MRHLQVAIFALCLHRAAHSFSNPTRRWSQTVFLRVSLFSSCILGFLDLVPVCNILHNESCFWDFLQHAFLGTRSWASAALTWLEASRSGLAAKFIMFPLIVAELSAQNWDPVLQSRAEHGRGDVQQRDRRASLRGVPGPPRPEGAAKRLQQVPCSAGQ